MPDALSEAELARQNLAALGEMRVDLGRADAELAEKIRKWVANARAAGVPMAEVARLLGMDRSAMYRTYVRAA